MENVNETTNKDTNNNMNIAGFGNYICKHTSTIAIVLSIISILFSTFALINVNRQPGRDFRAEMPYGIQSNMPDNYFNNGNFGGPGCNQCYGQRPMMRSSRRNRNNFNNNFSRSNGNGFNNNQNNQPNSNNGSRFNKPGQIPNGNQNASPNTNDGGPTVAPEISPSK